MTKVNNAKKALISSAFAMLVCVAMLIGTTFAWFTDTASTGVNRIQAGNLKIRLINREEDLTDKKLQWKVKNDVGNGYHLSDDVLWEPGCHFRTEDFYLVNDGNLAVKYKVNLNFAGDTKLLEALDFEITIIGGDVPSGKKTFNSLEEFNSYEGHLSVDENVKFLLNVYMKTTAGNEYQGLSLGDIRINVVATQYTYEKDSTGDQYDKDAKYPSMKMASFSGEDGTVDYNIIAGGYDGAIYADSGAKVTVNADVTAREEKGSAGTYAMAVWAKGADTVVTINGGYFTQEKTGVAANPNQMDMIYASGGAKINITGGTFKLMCGDYKWTLNCSDNSGSVITVTGGTFYKFNPKETRTGQEGEVVVPDGYTVVQNGDWYTVVAE